MLVLPPAMEPLFAAFAKAFTQPSFARFVSLAVGTIVTFGRRTVSRILWTLGPAVQGHPSSYHRLISQACWSLWPLGKILVAAVLELVPPEQAVQVGIDDTVTQHRGSSVWGKGCHRDATRSAGHATTVKKWGHRWVVLAILVRLPFAKRPWALPVLAALYCVPKVDAQDGRRHKTPCQLARQLLATLLHWFPQRRFVAIGDGGFASHDLAWFCHRHRDRVTLITRGRGDLNLHAMPLPHTPCRQTLWRRRRGDVRRAACRKGRKLPAPRDAVAAAQQHMPGRLPVLSLRWYGQSRRPMQLLSGCGGWYRGRGNGSAALLPLRWVFTHDPASGRDDWFLCTDLTMTPQQIVEHFATRWSIEVTFEEVRAHLGLETTRQRCRRSVLRSVPCLLGLFSVVSLIFTRLWEQRPRACGKACGKACELLHHTPCYHKGEPTFADALYAVRRELWDCCLLKHVAGPRRVMKLPRVLKRTLLTYLSQAA